MASIRESVEIEAPPERIWAVVHENVADAPKWSANLLKAELLQGTPPRKGSLVRYHIKTPGGVQQLDLEHTAARRPKSCAGRFVKGPLKGDWKYAYDFADGATTLTYTMDYGPAGLSARLFFGVIERQLPVDVRKTMRSLKRYVESGKGSAG